MSINVSLSIFKQLKTPSPYRIRCGLSHAIHHSATNFVNHYVAGLCRFFAKHQFKAKIVVILSLFRSYMYRQVHRIPMKIPNFRIVIEFGKFFQNS